MIVAFGHTSRVGKDHAAAHVCFRDFVLVRFAAPLYEIHDFMHGALGIPLSKNRNILNNVAALARQEFGDNVFVEIAKNKIITALAAGKNVVVPDLRFAVEREMLDALGAIIVTITRDQATINNVPLIGALDNLMPHIHIRNNGTIEQYDNIVQYIYDNWLSDCKYKNKQWTNIFIGEKCWADIKINH